MLITLAGANHHENLEKLRSSAANMASVQVVRCPSLPTQFYGRCIFSFMHSAYEVFSAEVCGDTSTDWTKKE